MRRLRLTKISGARLCQKRFLNHVRYTPIPIRLVLVVDPTGKMDPLRLVSSDPLMPPKQMIELYVDRWGIEVMFEKTRESLGVETQRQWSDKAIGRCTPVLMGL